MSNLLLVLILLFDLHPIKVPAFSDKLESYYLNKYILKQTDSGEKVTKSNIVIHSVPQKKSMEMTNITPTAYDSIDLDSGATLEEKNSTARLQIASLTKLMTAYLVLKDLPLDKVITVPPLNNQADDSLVGLHQGQQLTVKDALKGLLIESGGDAAQTLAIADAGSQEAFVNKMNVTAGQLGLNDTHFANPVGWDDRENFSSARDITNLARVLLRNEVFSEIVQKKSETITTSDGLIYQLSNTNKLLNSNFKGVKTGYTYEAGECLAALYTTDERHILTVVLNSPDRFDETQRLIDWISTHFLW